MVATQLNDSFSAAGVLRQATDLGDGVVKIVWASTDNIPLTPSVTNITTGIDFTASSTTLTGGTITVGGVSVELSSSAGLTASQILLHKLKRLYLQMIIIILHQVESCLITEAEH